MIPLFKEFPRLGENLAYVDFFAKPTPVTRLKNIGKAIGLDNLYIKQDGLTGSPFGGNKVRKLEFILADAVKKGFQEVMTFGYAGSNHALATSIHAKKLGLHSISMLLRQHNAQYVRNNLLMSLYNNTEIHHYTGKKILSCAIPVQNLLHKIKRGKKPYNIPPGGSTPRGITGFINAAFELNEQIKQNKIPKPDLLYIGLGTCGTYIGLLIGFKVLGLNIKIVPVRIIEHSVANEKVMTGYFRRTVNFLCSIDNTFPRISLLPRDLIPRDEFLGLGYAQFTRAGIKAIKMMEENEGIKLDGTYTGKIFSAIINDAGKGILQDKNVLFWNTLNSRDISTYIKGLPYQKLPKALHCYFTEEIPPFNRL